MHGENSWLLILEGTRYALLARDGKSFYFIEIGRYHTPDVERKLAGCSITRKTLEELDLKFSSLSCSNLRGVAIGGVEQGDSLYFYPVSGKRKTVKLGEDVSREWLDAFFADVERFEPPMDKRKRKQDPDYWRKERQDPELKRKLEWAVPGLTGISVVSVAGFMVTKSLSWFFACLACMVVPIVLDIVMPAYFTILSVDREKKRGPCYAISLLFPISIAGASLMLTYRWNVVREWQPVVAAAVLALLVGIVLLLLAEEFRRSKADVIVVILVGFLFCWGIVQNANILLDFHKPEIYTARVQELDVSNNYRRADDYYCTVMLPNGEERRVEVYKPVYDQLQVGDLVEFSLHPGALGIEYMDVTPME